MLVLSVLSLCLVSCEAYGGRNTPSDEWNRPEHHRPQKPSFKFPDGDDEFYVEVQTTDRSTNPELYKEQDIRNTHSYDSGIGLNFYCKHKHNRHDRDLRTTLYWIDSGGFLACRVHTINALKLQIIPDEADDGIIYTCVLEESSKEKRTISITLQWSKNGGANSGTDLVYTKDGHIYNRQKSRVLSPCNGTMSSTITHKTRINKDQILDIEETGNATSVLCGSYVYNYKYDEHKPICKRSIVQYIYYLNYMIATTTVATGDIFGISTTPNTNTGNLSDETSSSKEKQDIVGIVAGCLGAIIFLLILIILYMYYRKNQRNVVNEMHVIYADLEQRPAQNVPPLPRRNDPPYAKILGTLVPKHLSNGSSIQPNRDEPLYCTVE